MRSKIPGGAVGAVLVALGCRPDPLGLETDLTLVRVDTLVDADNEAIGRPSEIATGPDGAVYLIDASRPAVLALDSSGSVRAVIGRGGSGPGEFRRPRSLAIEGDTIRLVDDENGRVAMFLIDGQPAGSEPLPPGALSGAVSFGRAGAMLFSTNGRDQSLAGRGTRDGQVRSRLGAPIAPPAEVWDFAAIKKEIREGRVPGIIRNLVLPILGDGADAWLVVLSEGIVHRFSPTDSLLWTTSLNEPEFARIRDEFFAWNRADSNVNQFRVLRYAVTARASNDSLWILVNQPDTAPTLLLVLDGGGKLVRRIRIPAAHGVRGFALDSRRRWLYLLAYADAAILRTRLP